MLPFTTVFSFNLVSIFTKFYNFIQLVDVLQSISYYGMYQALTLPLKTLQRRKSRNRWVATVFIVMLSARMLIMADGVTTTSRPPAQSGQPGDKQTASGDFLAMSDIGTGKETNSRNFRVARSEFADYCLNGDCVDGDVLKVVSKLAKRILSDPRILGLRTASEPEDDDATDSAEASAARAIRGSSSRKKLRISNNRRNDEENAGNNDKKMADENKNDTDGTSSEETASKVKVDTTVNCYGASQGYDSSGNYWQDYGYNEAYELSPDYGDTEQASTNVGEGERVKGSAARAIDDSLFDTNSFTSRDDYYENDRITHRYDKNRLNDRYNDPNSYHAPASSYSNDNDKEYRVPGGERFGETYGYQNSWGKTKYSYNDRDDDASNGGGGGGGSYGYGGYEDSCCKSKLLPILLVGLLGLLGFFLYIRSTTVAGRRSMDENDLSDGKSLRVVTKYSAVKYL